MHGAALREGHLDKFTWESVKIKAQIKEIRVQASEGIVKAHDSWGPRFMDKLPEKNKFQ